MAWTSSLSLQSREGTNELLNVKQIQTKVWNNNLVSSLSEQPSHIALQHQCNELQENVLLTKRELMVTAVVHKAADSLKRSVPYSTVNRNKDYPAGLQTLKDKHNENSDSPLSPCIPVSKQWLVEESCWVDHTIVPSSAQQRAFIVQGWDWAGTALVCLLLANGT